MRKICTGPMQFTPYRPRTEGREAGARGRPPSDFWAEKNIQRLRNLHDEGLTNTQIAARMGTTKGAISGKLYRLAQSARSSDGSEQQISNLQVAGSSPAERAMLLLPPPHPKFVRVPLVTPDVIYLPGPPEPPRVSPPLAPGRVLPRNTAAAPAKAFVTGPTPMVVACLRGYIAAYRDAGLLEKAAKIERDLEDMRRLGGSLGIQFDVKDTFLQM